MVTQRTRNSLFPRGLAYLLWRTEHGCSYTTVAVPLQTRGTEAGRDWGKAYANAISLCPGTARSTDVPAEFVAVVADSRCATVE